MEWSLTHDDTPKEWKGDAQKVPRWLQDLTGKACGLLQDLVTVFSLGQSEEECGERVLHRFGHRTLPAENSSLEVSLSVIQRLIREPHFCDLI